MTALFFRGTLIALLRYGDLVGSLPEDRFDFVDNDLDFFVMVPGDEPYLWKDAFIPCLHARLGADMIGMDGKLVGSCANILFGHWLAIGGPASMGLMGFRGFIMFMGFMEAMEPKGPIGLMSGIVGRAGGYHPFSHL